MSCEETNLTAKQSEQSRSKKVGLKERNQNLEWRLRRAHHIIFMLVVLGSVLLVFCISLMFDSLYKIKQLSELQNGRLLITFLNSDLNLSFSGINIDTSNPAVAENYIVYTASIDDVSGVVYDNYQKQNLYETSDAFIVGVSSYLSGLQNLISREGTFQTCRIVQDAENYRVIQAEGENSIWSYSLYMDKDGVQETSLSTVMQLGEFKEVDWDVAVGAVKEYLGLATEDSDLLSVCNLVASLRQTEGGITSVTILPNDGAWAIRSTIQPGSAYDETVSLTVYRRIQSSLISSD